MAVLLRLALGGMLIYAGTHKLFGTSAFYQTIVAMELPGLGMQSPLTTIVAAHLAPFEIIVGACLILGLGTRGAALVAAGLFAGFVAVIAHLLYYDLPVDCGCLGPLLSEQPGVLHLLLDLAAFAAAL
ncbi:MAG: DoxX family membrane protein, partial [Phycisphaeraceae bacterium]|nr:DoxX family membrane protein [Phycisphaeraceae bacterium]